MYLGLAMPPFLSAGFVTHPSSQVWVAFVSEKVINQKEKTFFIFLSLQSQLSRRNQMITVFEQYREYSTECYGKNKTLQVPTCPKGSRPWGAASPSQKTTWQVRDQDRLAMQGVVGYLVGYGRERQRKDGGKWEMMRKRQRERERGETER